MVTDTEPRSNPGRLFERVRQTLAYWYFQWELLSCMYVMDPAEKVIFSVVLFAVLGILIYAGLTYIPSQLQALWV